MQNDKFKATIAFPSILELIEFEQFSGMVGQAVDNVRLAITGQMSQKTLDLALNHYKARLLHKDNAQQP